MDEKILIAIITAISGLFGALIGGGFSVWSTYITNNKSYKLQTDLENLKRKNEIKDLQRETLLYIQENLQKLVIMVNKLIDNKIEFDKEFQGGSDVMFQKDSDLVAIKVSDISLYVERIQNEELRVKTRIITNKITECANDSKPNEEKFLKVIGEYGDYTLVLGNILRKTY